MREDIAACCLDLEKGIDLYMWCVLPKTSILRLLPRMFLIDRSGKAIGKRGRENEMYALSG